MSTLLLNNSDISKDVNILSCVHEMHAGERSDSISLKVKNDTIDAWRIRSGMEIEYSKNGINTGKMHLYQVQPNAEHYAFKAYSMPISGTLKNTKSWERIHFRQLCEEIAGRNNLECELYGMPEILYAYQAQQNMEDFKFLGQLCRLERASMSIYDNKLIIAYEPYLESMEPIATIDTTGCIVECEDNSILKYDAAIVSCGQYQGTFKVQKKENRILFPQIKASCQSNIEAARFAAGELRATNKMLVHGSIEGTLSPYAPGIMVNIENKQMPTWSGIFFIYKVRHDYTKEKTKIFFRKTLEGY